MVNGSAVIMSKTINMKTIGEIIARIDRLKKEQNDLIEGSSAWLWYEERIKDLEWVIYDTD